MSGSVSGRNAARRVVIGVGNEYRRDDGFGPLVVAELAGRRAQEPWLHDVELRVSDGEPTRLLDLWTGAIVAVVVDAVRGDEHPGHRYELVLDPAAEPPAERPATSHAVSLGSTVALARALGRLPRRLVVLAVSGREFGFGTDLTAEVAAAVRPTAQRAGELARWP